MEVEKIHTTHNLLNPDSAKKNFAFQFLYQAVILILPLIVSPYLTRTLGGTSLGVYSYTYSIAYYFVLFAMLGINRHGQRIISQRRSASASSDKASTCGDETGDKTSAGDRTGDSDRTSAGDKTGDSDETSAGNDLTPLRKTFWSLFTVHLFASIMALAAYVIYVVLICKSDVTIAFVQTIYVASAASDLTWLFYGLEKFKMVAVRNAVIRLVNTGCIFLFIKQPSDVGIYTVIMAVSALAGHLVMIPQVIRAIPSIRFGKEDLREHINPLFTLFVAAVAISLYTMFDKTLLGIMDSKEAVAYYEYSNKIINIPTTFIAIISTVLYPKACQYAGVRDYRGMKHNMEKSLAVICLIGFASMPGLLAIADQFAVLYYGQDFADCGGIISAMCPLILISGIGEAVRSQYIYPLKMDAIMVKVVSLNAVVNLCISVALIPLLGVYGAVIGSIAAELTGLVVEIFLVRKHFPARQLILECLPYAAVGMVMFAIVKAVDTVLDTGWASLGIQVLTGAVVYCLGMAGYMFIFRKEFVNMAVKEVRRALKALKTRGGGV